MKKKHILVITQYFYPEQFRINDMCAEWVKRGYEVTVVTGYPNYPQGEYYDGYGWFKHTRQKWKGVKIIRLPLTARKQGSVRLAMNYFSFVVSGFFWALTTNIKADYVFTFEVSPMTQALIGVWYAKRRKIPHYLYVQDLWPENVEIVTGIHSPLVLKPIGAMVNYIYRHCDVIFATSPSFVKEIQKRVKKNKDKVKYLPQYAEDFYKPVELRDMDEILELIEWASDFRVGKPKKSNLNPGVPSTSQIIEFRDRFLKDSALFTGYDASEGALYVLFMLCLAMHPSTPMMFGIDSFDHAMNPRLAKRLTQVFDRLVIENGKTVFMTTHNPLVLDGLDLTDDRIRLFATERDDLGHVAVNRILVSDELIKTGQPLSRLWINGYLGGVPELI